MDPEQVPDDEMMLPVDMRGVGKDFDSIEDVSSAQLSIMLSVRSFQWSVKGRRALAKVRESAF